MTAEEPKLDKCQQPHQQDLNIQKDASQRALWQVDVIRDGLTGLGSIFTSPGLEPFPLGSQPASHGGLERVTPWAGAPLVLAWECQQEMKIVKRGRRVKCVKQEGGGLDLRFIFHPPGFWRVPA